jgi:glycosylphosphatidylinositol transamidase (GPIT) subunit GPI8
MAIIRLYALLLSAVIVPAADALHWAFLTAGSKTYDNYRHQADLCHAYQMLLRKGFRAEQIVVMAYDDIAHHAENPFPGKIFNAPDPNGPGVDVYAGCKIDYRGADVNAANFLGILLGNGTTGGNGRMLNSTGEDEVFVFYVDHGAPGVIEFPDGQVLHKSDLQSALTNMYHGKRFNHLVFYIEACNSGSMLEGFPTDMNVYGVTAVGPKTPSLGTYCGNEAVVNGTKIGSCLGDLFAVMWMQYVEAGTGTHTLDDFFLTVQYNVSSYAALHWGSEENQHYGDLSVANLTLNDFFYPLNKTVVVSETGEKGAPWTPPKHAFSATRVDMDRLQDLYSEASSQPTRHHGHHWADMRAYAKRLHKLLEQQEQIEGVYQALVVAAYPDPSDEQKRQSAWSSAHSPDHPECEVQGHMALVDACSDHLDMTTSFAMQFHQVVVNLCSDDMLGWNLNPGKAVVAARDVCVSKANVAQEIVI